MSDNGNCGQGPLNPPLSSLRVRSWNVNSNYTTLSNHLEDLQGEVDIFMIQEPSWKMIWHTASMTDPEGTPVIGPPHHLAWIAIYKPGTLEDRPRVAAYVSSRLMGCHPRVHHNLVDHHDLQLLSVTIGGVQYFLLNVYSDDRATGIQWLDANWDSLPSLCWMGGDFNCRDERWDPLVRRNINGDKLLAAA